MYGDLEHREHYVYVMWRDDEPLYVGMTSNYDKRLRSWRVFSPSAPKMITGSGWPTTVTHVDVWEVGSGRRNAEDVERATIRALNPSHNTIHSPRAERERELWDQYSAWAHAYSRAGIEPCSWWALDQATADRVCAAVGYVALDIAADQAERREARWRAVQGVA